MTTQDKVIKTEVGLLVMATALPGRRGAGSPHLTITW